MFNGRGCYALAKLWNMKSDLNVQSYNFFKKFYEIHTQQRSSHQCKLFALRYPALLLAPLPSGAAHSTLLLQERVSGWAARASGSGARSAGGRWRMSTAWVSTSPATTMTSAPPPRPCAPCAARCTATSTASGPTCTSRQRSTTPRTQISPVCPCVCVSSVRYRIALWEFPRLSVCVAQHKDQLFLLGQKKRGRRPGSASVTSLNKEIFPTSARQQSHYYNAHDNEDLLENRLSSPQDSKHFHAWLEQTSIKDTANYVPTFKSHLSSSHLTFPVSRDPVTDLVTSGLMQFLGQNNANSAAANAIMMQRLLGSGYELHPLGSRKDNDPMAHVKVARSSKGWHCPQCIHISSTKGNLKSHILSGRHKSYTEKPFGCQYCDRSYGTKQSLQVNTRIYTEQRTFEMFYWLLNCV